MLAQALTYLENGWSVIPVQQKRPLVAWKAYQERHASEDEVRAWYEQWPEAGVGVVTGAISGLVVLDIDGMVEDPADWVYAQGLTTTLTAKTPRGGLHLYYGHVGGVISNSAKTLSVGGLPADIRGDGGFVVAPPTPGYQWLTYWRGVVDWVSPRQHPGQRQTEYGLDAIFATSTVDDLFRPAAQGERNHHAAKLAGYLLKVSDEAAAWVQLRQWNDRNLPPLPESELQTTFSSIARRERLKPAVQVSAPFSSNEQPDEPDWLEGAAWAEEAANTPERNGQRLHAVPICEEHKGFEPGDIVTIAARQGTGKTSLATNMFWEIGKGLAESAFFFSGDMSPSQILQWMTKGRLAKGYYTREEWDDSLQMLRDSKMAIKYSGFIATERIQQMLEQRAGTRYVFIDHFNKMRTGSETRATDLKRVASDLKDMAGHYRCTFIVLSQLNRLADNVEFLLPSHLSESDALVSESDVIYGLSCVGDRTKQDPDRATVRLALLKNRFGREFVEQIAWFHKATKQFEWLNRELDWRTVA